MNTNQQPSAARDELARIIHGVRRRWRTRMAVRGGAIVLAIAAAAIIFGVLLAQGAQGSPSLLNVARGGVLLVIIAATARFLVMPLSRRVTDQQVALYIEEHEPGLEAAILSAVEVTREEAAGDQSPALVEQLVESATRKAHHMDAENRVERGALNRATGTLAAIVAVTLALAFLGPEAFRSGLRTLFVPWSTADAAAAYSIGVTPGNATVARGGDLRVAARLSGFTADEVEIAVRRGTETEWRRMPMGAGADSVEHIFRLFDLDSAAEYFVEATGIRSPVFRIEVTELPYVSRIDLEYRFPAYLGREVERVEDGGDIVAIRGTTVIVQARTTIPAEAGRVIIEGRDTIPMTRGADSTLSAPIVIDSSGFYRIELQARNGNMVNASLDYSIDVLADLPPGITFTKPSRDIKVTSLEEVFTEVRAEDDNGIGAVELRFSVNGGEEQRVPLHRAGRRPRTEISAGHTFFLEELSLEPGDIVSYYARATDARAIGTPATATTDIYFMEIRPFDREYRQAEQGGGGGGGGGGEEPPSVLSQRQREIIAGTFNTERDRATATDREFRENVATLVLAQGRLREQVDALNQRMRQRGGIDADSTLRAIAEELPRASAAMREAEERLGRRDAKGALPHEQRALQHLQRAEAAFREVQVAFGGGGGGGGGGEQPDAEDLADLFELETDRLRNQYETVEQGQRQERNQEVDETLERLKQLAARQQRENERARQLAESMGGPGGGGGGGEGQRQLARETEELARQLERLARENPDAGLGETARRLQDAANEMRRSAAGGASGGASGAEALERLQSARRLLDESRESRLERDVRDAARRAEQLAEEQRRVAADVAGLPGAADRAARERRIEERKDAQAGEVRQLESMLDRLARESRREQAAASRKLQEAAGSIRDNRLEEKIRFSRSIVRGGSEEYARNFEEQIGANIEEMRRRITEAAGTMAEAPEKRVAQALDRTRDLVRGLESLEERLQEKREGSRRGLAGDGEGEEGTRPGEQEGGQQPGQGKGESDSQPGGNRSGTAGGEANPQGEPSAGAPGQGRPGGASSGAPGGGWGRLTPDDTRQFRREFRDRRESAEALRRELAGQGRNVADLERLIARLRELESRRGYDDAEEIARLQSAVIEGFKAFEFALWRDVAQQTGTEPRLEGSDEVPAGFRALVEEYYRSLAKSGRR